MSGAATQSSPEPGIRNSSAGRPEIPGLTGLRAIAWMGVVVAHTSARLNPESLPGVPLGLAASTVTLFFVLSGFLIYLPFAAALLRDEPGALPSLRRYTSIRVFRVYPAYLAIFVLVNFLFGAAYLINPTALATRRSDVGTGTMTDGSDLLLNLSLLHNLIPDLLQTGINPSWTLTVELAFYLMVPVTALVAMAGRRRWGGRLVWAVVPAVLLILLSVVGRVVVAAVASGRPAMDAVEASFGDNAVAVLQRSLLVFADNFGLGMLVAVAYLVAVGGSGASRRRRALTAYALSLVTCFALTLLAAAHQSNLGSLAFGCLSATLIAMMVLPPRLGGVPWLARLADAGPLHYLGVISFSLYLWHFPVLLMMSRFGLMFQDTAWGLLANLVVVSTVSTVLSVATYHGLERPGQRLGRRLAASFKPVARSRGR